VRERAAIALGERICANAPVAVQASLVAVNRWLAAADEFGWQVTAEALATIGESQDHKEGIAAFLEKRPPAGPAGNHGPDDNRMLKGCACQRSSGAAGKSP
jgi:enoyl-CoA hydratase/carnithine racemase